MNLIQTTKFTSCLIDNLPYKCTIYPTEGMVLIRTEKTTSPTPQYPFAAGATKWTTIRLQNLLFMDRIPQTPPATMNLATLEIIDTNVNEFLVYKLQ